MYKIDLHTHSVASPDGGLTQKQYRQVLTSGLVDVVAITDHNRVDFALNLREQIGDNVIVGEEIMTTEGEIIGLYLSSRIEPGLTPFETIEQIKEQGGLVYIPHPIEKVRRGLSIVVLEELVDNLDLIEIANGRALLASHYSQMIVWANLNKVVGVASSDAHGIKGMGRTYTQTSELPTRPGNLLELCASGVPIFKRPTLRAVLYPKYHRLKKKHDKH